MVRILLFSFLALTPAFIGATEPLPAGPRYLVLRQIEIAGAQYFVPAGAENLLMAPTGAGTRSNVIAWAGTVGGRLDAHRHTTLIDQWLDLGGHIHTRDILTRQMEYLGLRHEALRERRLAVALPYIVPSGAMTLETMRIPAYRLEVELATLRAACPANAVRSLNEPRKRIDAYRSLLDGLARRATAPLPDDWRVYNPPEEYWGLDDISWPYLGAQAPQDYGRRPAAIRVYDDAGYVPAETIDIGALTPQAISDIAAAETSARDALSTARRACGGTP